ncbi:succinyl-diaminopimelate desuccinylase [Pseudemcibacter aquimaris]|uniref:succinyl-diaminopimelate desuccinylase n=1 Tax=Pseudemcibacter aquimaris TaxID=2857064 RepID=UPI002010DF1B|nr:succinyl-diaminopimelate desuccinylase [Pseudemcibacter aquimaris]MCC3861031.1 succinyl-diaminopimelate desuccinylase [Pseudemcibacter aquimaris]WDU59849.1 succinyl-diaminopimelate desuccinylase [Pseudemcibacter aquimaris]
MPIDPIVLSQDLIRCPSVTPRDAGALDVLEKALSSMGFECTRLPFSDDDTPDIDNLYARKGNGKPHICYAGHTDVVPAGNMDEWKHAPFDAVIEGDILYGRGTSDMKCSIAAFTAAVSELDDFDGSVSLLITGDEEGPAINGTIKMLKWLEENDQVPDYCIVGEPTNVNKIGDMVKVGRRGSLNGTLTIFGTQGHVAYPHLANNPIPGLVSLLDKLANTTLDNGNEFFDASNLEIVSIDVGNKASNVIPMNATAKFNIRFNNEHSPESLTKWLYELCDESGLKYDLDINVSGDSFLTPEGLLTETIVDAIKEHTNFTPNLSTTGGTSDARFIKNYCPVVEFGLTNKTIHKVNESAKISDIILLKNIYLSIIRKFFS